MSVPSWIQKRTIAYKNIKPVISETKETKQSGIYLFERTDEHGITFFYCGQAKNIFDRMVSHWNGHIQRIDLSIKKRKWYDAETNIYGWRFTILEYCSVDMLDERETYWILENLKLGKQTYNKTYGSQGEGKEKLQEYKPPKTYREGIEKGKENMLKDIKVFFEKYLDVVIKEPSTKIKERKLEEFKNLIK